MLGGVIYIYIYIYIYIHIYIYISIYIYIYIFEIERTKKQIGKQTDVWYIFLYKRSTKSLRFYGEFDRRF